MEPFRWRSPSLGSAGRLDLAAGPIEYFDRGEGPALVFAHGWLANANLWRAVVEELAADFRCVTLDLPLGSHRVALDPGADLSTAGCGALITGALDALDLQEVTLVGNDSGGAYSQIAVAADPGRVARLVLNACETPFDSFPPPPFEALPAAAADPTALGQLLAALRDPAVRTTPAAYGLLIKHPLDDLISDSYVLPCLTVAEVLRDIAKVMSGTTPDAHHQAGATLIEGFERPVLFSWSPEDRVFQMANAERYASALADGTVTQIPDSYPFAPEDQPRALAAAIRLFCRVDLSLT